MNLKRNILVVEDEPINRELLRIFLEENYNLTFSEDSNNAIDCIKNAYFDLIITDIRLGNFFDGTKILFCAKQSVLNNNTPVIAYTASQISINQKSFVEEGFSEIVLKPSTRKEILKKIAGLI